MMDEDEGESDYSYQIEKSKCQKGGHGRADCRGIKEMGIIVMSLMWYWPSHVSCLMSYFLFLISYFIL